MATKIGFKAQPLIDSGGVDWLSVSKDVVKTLTLQEEAREATRVKEQENYAADIKKMVETPLGKDAEANEWLTNGINSISGSAGMDNKLWRSGALSTKDYMRNRANRTQGTDLVLSAFKTYNENYDAVMDGIDDGSLAKDKMLFLRAQAESMFDFGKTGIYINPLNSEINVAKKELVDGAYVMSDNPDEFLNASELMQAASAMYKGFDANKAAATLAEGVAQTILRTVGGTDIVEAYRAVEGLGSDEQKKLNKARLDQVRAILNDEAAGAYLTDTLKEGFSFTKNSDKARTVDGEMSKMILLNQDGSTTLSKEQMDYAVDKFNNLLEVYLPKTRKEKIVSETDKSKKADSTKEGNKVSDLAKMQSGTKQERIVSASDAAGRDDSVTQIIETVDDIYFVRTDAKGNVTTTPYPRPESTINWVKGAASGVTDIEDLTKALKFSGIEEGMTRADITKDGALKTITLPDGTTVLGNVLFKRTAPAKKKLLTEQLSEDVVNNIRTIKGTTQLVGKNVSESTVREALRPFLNKYSIQVEDTPGDFSGQNLDFILGETRLSLDLVNASIEDLENIIIGLIAGDVSKTTLPKYATIVKKGGKTPGELDN